MGFVRPVDPQFPVKTRYRERGAKYDWSVDPDNGLWIPVRDRHGFGEHCGTDFECDIGVPVRAIADGLIIRSRYENTIRQNTGAGLYITQLITLLGHDSWVLKYSHLKASHVSPGQMVKQGEPIAESGNSGNCLSPYLHVDLLNLKYQWKEIVFD